MITRFEFDENNVVKMDCEANQCFLYRNDKALYALKGNIKYIVSMDKKGNLISVVFKIKDVFNHVYFVAFTKEEDYMRNSLSTIASNLVRFSKDVKPFIRKVEKL